MIRQLQTTRIAMTQQLQRRVASPWSATASTTPPPSPQADLGIALGSGSDIAKETGDIVLVGGSLTGVAAAIRLSRATMRSIRQNLFFAFIYNVLAIPLAAWVAEPADRRRPRWPFRCHRDRKCPAFAADEN